MSVAADDGIVVDADSVDVVWLLLGFDVLGVDVNKTKNAKSFYLLGSDYIWPRTMNKIALSPNSLVGVPALEYIDALVKAVESASRRRRAA